MYNSNTSNLKTKLSRGVGMKEVPARVGEAPAAEGGTMHLFELERARAACVGAQALENVAVPRADLAVALGREPD